MRDHRPLSNHQGQGNARVGKNNKRESGRDSLQAQKEDGHGREGESEGSSDVTVDMLL